MYSLVEISDALTLTHSQAAHDNTRPTSSIISSTAATAVATEEHVVGLEYTVCLQMTCSDVTEQQLLLLLPLCLLLHVWTISKQKNPRTPSLSTETWLTQNCALAFPIYFSRACASTSHYMSELYTREKSAYIYLFLALKSSVIPIAHKIHLLSGYVRLDRYPILSEWILYSLFP